MSRDRRLWAGALLVIALVVLAAFPPITAAQADQIVLDWEVDADGNPINTGQVIDDEYHTSTGVSVTVQVSSPNNIAAIFPSHAPPTAPNGTTIDPDLGSPNETCGGPGIGVGGEVGEPGENCMNHENVLIMPTSPDSDGDGFINGPPDDDDRGGTVTLLFSEEVILDYAEILDQESQEALTINAYADLAGATTPLESESPSGFGDNSYERIMVGAEGARRIDFIFAGSGAISNVAFTPVEPTAVTFSGVDVVPGTTGIAFFVAVAILALFSIALLALRASRPR